MAHTVWVGSVPGDLSAKLNPSALILWVYMVKLSQKKWFRPWKKILEPPGGHNVSIKKQPFGLSKAL